MTEIQETLQQRGRKYGEFKDHAFISQQLKNIIHTYFPKLTDYQKEALEMIMHKVARILNGDPNYVDSWHDIAGYATLVVDRLNSLSDTSVMIKNHTVNLCKVCKQPVGNDVFAVCDDHWNLKEPSTHDMEEIEIPTSGVTVLDEFGTEWVSLGRLTLTNELEVSQKYSTDPSPKLYTSLKTWSIVK